MSKKCCHNNFPLDARKPVGACLSMTIYIKLSLLSCYLVFRRAISPGAPEKNKIYINFGRKTSHYSFHFPSFAQIIPSLFEHLALW